MTEQKLLDEANPIIHSLATIRSAKGAFAYYENNDIYQEVWCMCLEALDRYDPTIGPLENYLVRHVSNRIKNLKRDKYFRPGSDMPTSGLARTKMNLVNALPLNVGDVSENGVLLGSTPINIDPVEYITCEETLIYIRERLPYSLREPFEDLIGNNKVRSPLADEVRRVVAEILIETDDDDVGD